MERRETEAAIMQFAIACSELDMLQRELKFGRRTELTPSDCRMRILKSAEHLDKVNKFLAEVLKESKDKEDKK